jgi:hypothetical protein
MDTKYPEDGRRKVETKYSLFTFQETSVIRVLRSSGTVLHVTKSKIDPSPFEWGTNSEESMSHA